MKVFISSTNKDLRDYRDAARDAVLKANEDAEEKMVPDMQEYWGPDGKSPPLEVCLEKVRDADILVVIVAHRYGWVPEEQSNGDRKSITWLECEEANNNGKEIITFIVKEDYEWSLELKEEHDLAIAAKENKLTPELALSIQNNVQQLNEFKNWLLSKKVCSEFTSCEDLGGKVLSTLLKYSTGNVSQLNDSIPSPPEFYAEPKYIGSHKFIGRKAQLEIMNDWAKPSDPRSVLLFEAIGGTGKSILTWQWITNHSTESRNDWAGRFWYSFYERGAMMTDFCSHALAYMTGQPLEELQKKDNVELMKMVLRELNAHPWLLVLDGIERILVEYHRSDAAHISDEEADRSEDQIAQRDPTLCIHPEDDEFLRELTGENRSKILISSRLVPRTLLNSTNQPLPGVRKEILPGLYPPEDAEALLKSCDVIGDSKKMQEYLKNHCDCHPLVTGTLAGLINDYLPDRGNFDAWSEDPEFGGKFDLADLDLVQKRNHILHDAISGVPERGRELLYRIAFLSESVDYSILKAFNPHMPPEPLKPVMPPKPVVPLINNRFLQKLKHSLEELKKNNLSCQTDIEKGQEDIKKLQKKYDMVLEEQEKNNLSYQTDNEKYQKVIKKLQKEYDMTLEEWKQSPEVRNATKKLAETVKDLEHRGLLQYDNHQRRYDLHPVVRSIVFKSAKKDKDKFLSHGQYIVDHFSHQAHDPYEEAETLQDLAIGLQMIETLLDIGKYDRAYEEYSNNGLDNALCFNLEAYSEELSLLKPFFPEGWDRFPKVLSSDIRKFQLANNSAWSLYETGQINDALKARVNALKEANKRSDHYWMFTNLRNMCSILFDLNKLAEESRCLKYAHDLVLLNKFLNDGRVKEDILMHRFLKFRHFAAIGLWQDAENMWNLINGLAYSKSHGSFRPGDVNCQYAQFNFWRGIVTEECFLKVEQLAEAERNHPAIRKVYKLRGEWQIENEQWEEAIVTLNKAVQKSREIGIKDAKVEALRLLAKFHLGQLQEPVQESETLSYADGSSQRSVAELWFAIGDLEKAKEHALAAYNWVLADGEPFVHRYELDKTCELLEKLNMKIPVRSPYIIENDIVPQWEKEVRLTIEESFRTNQPQFDKKNQKLKVSIEEMKLEIADQKKSTESLFGSETKRALLVDYKNLWTMERNFGKPVDALFTARKGISLLQKWTENEQDPGDYYDLACTNAFIYQLIIEEELDTNNEGIPLPNEVMEQAVQYIIKSVEAGWKNIEHLKTDPDLGPIRYHPKFIKFIEQLD